MLTRPPFNISEFSGHIPGGCRPSTQRLPSSSAGLMEAQTRAEVLAAVSDDPANWLRVPEHFRDDEDTVLEVVGFWPPALGYLSRRLQTDREFWLRVIPLHAAGIEHADHVVRDDEAVMLLCVQQDGDLLRAASRRVAGCRAVLLAAVQQQPMALRWVSPLYPPDRELCLLAVQGNGLSIASRACGPFRQDTEFMRAAVASNGMSIGYILPPDDLRLEFTITAVKQNGTALRHVDKELLSKEICLLALRQSWRAFPAVPPGLRADPDILRAVLEQWPEAPPGPWNLHRAATTHLRNLAGETWTLPPNAEVLQAGDVLFIAGQQWLFVRRAWQKTTLLREDLPSGLDDCDVAVLPDLWIQRILTSGAAEGIYRRAPGYTVVQSR